MIVVEAPKEIYSLESEANRRLFLAGGITNCPDWQQDFIKRIQSNWVKIPITIYNPRRKNFPKDNTKEAERQIIWEFKHLHDSDIIVFWFSEGSLNPIVLYELGKWGNSSTKPIFVGTHPHYERKIDVVIQTKLARPEIEVVDDLGGIVHQVNMYLRRQLCHTTKA